MQPSIIDAYFARNPQAISGSDVTRHPVAPAPGKKKDPKIGSGDQHFLSSLISETGGTGGALAGAATGAAIGSIVPGIGTAIGGIAGGLIGGFAGGTGGRLLENQVRDHEMRPGDALKEGAISGVMGAGPGNILKLAGKGSGIALKGGATTLENAITEAGANQAGKTAAVDAAGAPLKTSLRGKLKDKGNQLLGAQWGTLDQPTIKATMPAKTVGQLADIGVFKPSDAERIAQGLTGTTGAVNKAVIKAVGGASNVPVEGVPAILKGAIVERNLSGLPQAKPIENLVQAQLDKLGPNPSASQVFDTMKRLEKSAADLEGKGGNYKRMDPIRGDQANVLRDVRNHLQQQLDTAGASTNLSTVLTPQLRQEMINLHPNNARWQQFVNDKIMNAKSIGELRSAEAPFVRASQMVNNAAENSFSVGGKTGNFVDHLRGSGGIGGVLAGTVMNAVKNPASRVAGQALRTAGGAGLAPLAAPGMKAVGSMGLAGGALKTAGEAYGAVRAGMPVFNAGVQQADATAANSPQDLGTAATDGGFISGSNVNGQVATMGSQGGLPMPPTDMQQPAQANPYSREALIADIQRDPKHADAYIGYYKSLDDIFNPQASGKLNATQIQQANTAQSGIDSLSEIGQTLQSNPNAAKMAAMPGGSLTQNLTGTGSYMAARANAIDAIGRLRSGGAIGAEEQKNFMRFLPAAFDDPQTVQYKLQTLNNIFQRFANPQPGSLADASTITQGGYQ